MRCFQCQCRFLARRTALRQYSHHASPFTPQHTDYYALDLSDPDLEPIFGAPRVERTKIEAAARKIAERLFLHDEANRALLEQELEMDGAKYLKDYVDTRDAQPPAAHLSSSQVSDRLYELLGPRAQAHGRQSRELLSEVARFMATHQVVKLSDYHRMIRWLLNAQLVDAAAEIMDTLLMSRQTGFSTSTYTLCLELALLRHDAGQFGELVKRVKWKRNRWLTLQHKFDSPQFDGKNPTVIQLLASGYLQFNRSNDLTYVMEHAPALTMDLLIINMKAAAKWNDADRAKWTLDKLEELVGTQFSDVSPEFWEAAERIKEVRNDVLILKRRLTAA